nr:unnamed protein product [Naegleria fowleri]
MKKLLDFARSVFSSRKNHHHHQGLFDFKLFQNGVTLGNNRFDFNHSSKDDFLNKSKFKRNITILLIAGVGISLMIDAWRNPSIAEFHAEENYAPNHLAFTSQSLDFKKTSNGMCLSEDLVSSSLLKEITTYLVFHVKSLPIGAVTNSGRISGGTCFVVSPIVAVGNNRDIYLVTAAHCVITPYGDVKRVGLIPKYLEKQINNHSLTNSTKMQKELIECEIVEFHYDGENDIDYAILKCNADEFIRKNRYDIREIPEKYFIPKEHRSERMGTNISSQNISNICKSSPYYFDTIVIGYPSRYKQFMDARTRNDPSLSLELINQLMMTNEKSPIISLGNIIGHQFINNNTLIRYFSNTINKGFSGGPVIDLRELHNTRNGIPFSGIVSLFDEKGFGAFCVENHQFMNAYFRHIAPYTTK